MKKSGEKMVVDSIEGFVPINNKVLVRVDFDPENDRTPAGIYKGSGDWDEAGHVARFGTVTKIPVWLIEIEYAKFGIEWGTKSEVAPGDVVYFGKIAAYKSDVIECDGVTYFVVDYSDLILRVRDGEIYPLNGYILVEKVEEKAEHKGLILDFSKKQNKKKGVIKYIGTPLEYYFPKRRMLRDPSGLKVGDTILFSISGWTELEDDRYTSLEANLGYIQGRWVSAVLIE